MKWERVGAWQGGTVLSVAVSPNFVMDGVVLAATGAGLLRSDDGGTGWEFCSADIAGPGVVAVTFASAGDNGSSAAFASTDTGRLYRSEDGGQTWREVSAWAGLGIGAVLAASPSFAADGMLFVATAEGVFRTLDGGDHWESSTFGMLDLDVLCLACAPNFGERPVLWAGTSGGGLYRSRNGGRAWRESGNGLPDTAIQVLVVSPNFAEDGTLWVGTETSGIYRSTDGGATWHSIGAQLVDQSINSLCVLPVTDGAAVNMVAGTGSGVYYSLDSGASWQTSGNGEFFGMALAAGGDDIVLAGSHGAGMMRSVDGGVQWAVCNDGFAAHAPPIIVMTLSGEYYGVDGDGYLACSEDGSVWRELDIAGESGLESGAVDAIGAGGSSDAPGVFVVSGTSLLWRMESGQDSWEKLSLPADLAGMVSVLEVSPGFEDDGLLLVGAAHGALYLGHLGERPGEESGESSRWQRLSMPAQQEYLLHVRFSPFFVDDRRLLSMTGREDGQGNTLIHVWEATGDEWLWENMAELTAESPGVLLELPPSRGEQPCVLATQNRVIKLYMDAATGELAVTQSFLAEGMRISALVPVADCSTSDADMHTDSMHPDRQKVWVGTTDGIYCSTDNGETWQKRCEPFDKTPVVKLLPRGDDGLVAVTLGGTVWRSR